MLERGRVEDHLRAAGLEQLGDELGVADVAEHRVVRVQQGPAREAELDGVQGGLVAVEHDQLGRVEPRDLAAQLGADRAAGAGDQHPLAGEVRRDRPQVGVDHVAPEQVGDVDVADVGDRGTAGLEQLAGSRQHLDVEPALRRSAADLPDRLGACARDRDDRSARAGLVPDLGQVARRPHHRDAANAAVPLRGVVIDQADRAPLRAGVAAHGVDQLPATFAGADHQRRLGAAQGAVAERVVTRHAVDAATPDHREHRAERSGDEDDRADPDVDGESDDQHDDADHTGHRGDQERVLEAAGRGPALVQAEGGAEQQERTGRRAPDQERAVDVLRRAVVHDHLQPGECGEAEDPGGGVEHDEQERAEGAHPAQDVLNHRSVLSVCLRLT